MSTFSSDCLSGATIYPFGLSTDLAKKLRWSHHDFWVVISSSILLILLFQQQTTDHLAEETRDGYRLQELVGTSQKVLE